MKSISLTESEINHIKEMYLQELERLEKRTSEISAILKKIETQENSQLLVPKIKEAKITEKPKGEVKKALKADKKAKAEPVKKLKKTVEIPSTDIKATKRRGRPAKQKAEVIPAAALKEKVAPALKAKKGRKPKIKEIVVDKPSVTLVAAKAKAKDKVAEKPKKNAAKPKKEAKVVKKKAEKSKKAHWTASILEILDKAGKVLTSRQIIDQIMAVQKISDSNRPKTRSVVTGSLSDLKLETKRVKSMAVPGQKGELYGLTQWYDDAGNLLDKYKN